MKKLVFVSLLGLAAAPGLASAQTEELEGHPVEEPTTPDVHEDMPEMAEEAEPDWTDHLTYNIFADTFYQHDWNRPINPNAMTAVPHRGYEYTEGFGLAFAGVDASYTSEHVGATVSLRYGVGAQRYLIGGNSMYDPADPTDPTGTGGGLPVSGGVTPALAAVKQAFGSLMPMDGLTIDVGLFDTIYGAEVADSWVNFNYTRSPLNYLLQPFYHLGVRASYQVNDNIVVRGLVANPTNAYNAFNGLPYLGGQVAYVSDHVSVYGGYMTGSLGAGATDRGPWEHFVDVVATASFGDFSLVGNFDLWHHRADAGAGVANQTAYGFSVVGAYRISDLIGVAARFDYINNDQGYMATNGLPAYDMVVGTATLDVRPWGDHVILRLEHRFEHATQDIYVDRNTTAGPTAGSLVGGRDTWMSTTLSAVIRTGN